MKKILSVIIAVCLMLTPFVLTACVPPAPTLTLSANNDITELKPGESVQLSTNSSSAVTYEFTQGEGKATVTDAGLLTVKADTEVGTKIKIAAKTSSLTSNELLFTVVHIPLTKIEASVNTTSLLPGGTATLSYVLTPANTTQTDIEWKIVNAYRFAETTGNTLTVDNTASVQSGDIEIQASYGNIKSNVVTVAVVLPTDKLEVDADNVIVIKNFSTGTDTVFTVDVTDENGYSVSDANVTFEVTQGHTLIDIIPISGSYGCTVKLRGHGTAKITTKIDNVPKHTVTVHCIKTPTMIELPAYISDKTNQRYAVGKDQPVDFAALIPATAENEQVCTDILYTFEKVGAPAETGLATYADGKITFLKTGTIKVTATTASGNTGAEKIVTREFIVNEGKNVSTWEEAKTELESDENAEVNFVVTQKPGAESRYSLVPRPILEGKDTLAGIVEDVNHAIEASDWNWYIAIKVAKSVKVNGNNHPVDMSALKKIKGVGGAEGDLVNLRFPAVFDFNNAEQGFDVKLNDLKIWGNVEMDGSTSSDRTAYFVKDGSKLNGVQSHAIQIGRDDVAQNYNVIMDNIEVRNFHVGMRITRTLPDSICSNIAVTNCYTNGIEAAASILEFNNLKIGVCGATGIEITPDFSGNAGVNQDLTQEVTFTGKLEVNNVNSGNTQYMLDYVIMGLTVAEIITGVLTQYTPAVQSHIINSAQEFMFIAFVFHNPDKAPPDNVNQSDIICANAINISEIAGNTVNETAEFITMPVITQFGNMGTVLVRNWHYRAPTTP